MLGNAFASFLTMDKECKHAKLFVKVAIDTSNNTVNNNKHKHNGSRIKKRVSQNIKHFDLFVASPYRYVHLSSLKSFNIDNRQMFQVLSNVIEIGNVNDIQLPIWMSHACCINKKQLTQMYGDAIHNVKGGLCNVVNDTLVHNCRYNKLFFLDPYTLRWNKLLYRIACPCDACK